MSWFIKFLRSSVGQKLIMSLTGLFLIIFLIVHLLGNLQLLQDDGGEAFNGYTYFMTHNPLIKVVSYGLYLFILLHVIQGIEIKISNWRSRPSKYAVASYPNASFASKNMALLGILIFAFLCIHMGDFWYKMKFTDQMAMKTYPGLEHEVKDLYTSVIVAFKELWILIVYLVGMIALAYHLYHGFQSAFQSLGINHKKYTPAIKFIGVAYSILVPLGFAIIPIYIYFFSGN